MTQQLAHAEPAVNGHVPAGLLPQHWADLQRSGLTAETVQSAGLYSTAKPAVAARLLGCGIPKAVAMGNCLAFPFFNPDGSPMGYARLKPDNPQRDKSKKGKKEGRLRKYEAPRGQGNRAYFPPLVRGVLADPAVPLLIAEGEKKGLAGCQAGFLTVAISGVWNWCKARGKGKGQFHLIDDLAAVAWKDRAVTIAFDSDGATNRNVQLAAWCLARELQRLGATVKVVFPDPGPSGTDGEPGKVGLDDLLLSGGPAALQLLLNRAGEPTPPPDSRGVVVLGVEEHAAIDQAVRALAKADRGLFQRANQLVRVVKPSAPVGAKRFRSGGGPRIEPVPLPDLRRRLSRYACCVKVVAKGDKQESVRQPPTGWLVEGVAALASYRGVRHLEAVVESPVLRPDGTVLERPGYDRATGLLYRPRGTFPRVPAAPTRGEAEQACTDLLDVWSDFPFAAPHDSAAALAAALTPVARFAIEGPTPLTDISANVRGAGKGLLADTFALIGTGRPFARASYSPNDEEMRKTITSLALSGEKTVLLDNITGQVGVPSLDRALTATEWQDRLLGGNRVVTLPLLVSWFATGNNIVYRGDCARRVQRVRLECPDERPEEREGFRRPDLLAWVRQERARLLVAALTILAAYCRAGRPAQRLKPWGSYENWTALIRAALVWAGQPDPGEARMSLVHGGDREAVALEGLLAGWSELDPGGQGLTVKEALGLLRPVRQDEPPDNYPIMRGVLAELFDLRPGELPKSGAVGYKLRAFAGRVCGGRAFAGSPGHGGVMRWKVKALGTESPTSALSGGDGGNGGDVSPFAGEGSLCQSVRVEGGAEESPPSTPSQPIRATLGFEEGEL